SPFLRQARRLRGRFSPALGRQPAALMRFFLFVSPQGPPPACLHTGWGLVFVLAKRTPPPIAQFQALRVAPPRVFAK
ncbi:MAG: hypothetical protein RSC06_07140, partial [Clostridia bacterium]